MPYEAGQRLPGERASRLGHLDVLKSPLVKQLCETFEDTQFRYKEPPAKWQAIPGGGDPLRIVFAVDGSLQVIENELPPNKALAFVKTALLRVDRTALDTIDRQFPHPYAIRDLMTDSALYHATVFPMRHVSVEGMNGYDAVRTAIFQSVNDASLEREPMETLKWIAYEKWDDTQKSLPAFECPHCGDNGATLPFDAERGPCPRCGNELLLTDMLGFHLDMSDEAASNSVATAYMLIHETLLLFTGIRYYWNNRRDVLADCLFIKDGPLAMRAQYSKLVAPIRRFLQRARDEGVEVCLLGQEKSGAFFDHLALIGRGAPTGSIFVPGHEYIRAEIQYRPANGAPYGKDTNYGSKVFLKLDERHQSVLNIPTGEYAREPTVEDLIGKDRIFATIPTLLSNQHEGALFPIELAHNVASLSTYPSAKVLSMFAEATQQTKATP
ncbi:MAG: hypothetical protein U1B94_06900 [candidate division NC10 bacterium]|nr:hypothetical protein [candidate division NC10 bacterium]